jgi:hypothetical protein
VTDNLWAVLMWAPILSAEGHFRTVDAYPDQAHVRGFARPSSSPTLNAFYRGSCEFLAPRTVTAVSLVLALAGLTGRQPQEVHPCWGRRWNTYMPGMDSGLPYVQRGPPIRLAHHNLMVVVAHDTRH